MAASAVKLGQSHTRPPRKIATGAPAALAVLALVILALGLFIALGPLTWVTLGLAGMAAVLVILIRPIWGVYLLAFAIPFGSLRQISVGGTAIGGVEAFTGLVTVAWLARMIAAREIRLTWPPLALPLFLLLFAMGLSVTGAISLTLSAQEIVKWLEVLAIYLFLVNNATAAQYKALLAALLLAGSAEALLGLYQFVRGVGPEGFILMGRFMRAYGTFAQPNPFAGYLGLTLPLSIGVLIGDPCALWQGWRTKDWGRLTLAWVAAASALLMGGALIASWSRGGWLGFGVALVAMALFLSRRFFLVVVVVAALIALFLVSGGLSYVPPSIVRRVTDMLPYASGIDIRTVEVDDNNWALVERLAHWEAALGMFADHPWLGVGIGNYAAAYPQYALPRWQDPLGHAHNYYLNIAAEAGLVGLGTYLVFFLVSLVQVFRTLKGGPHPRPLYRSGRGVISSLPPQRGKVAGWTGRSNGRTGAGLWRGVALGVLGLLVYLMVHSAVDNLYVHGMYLMVAFGLALLYQAGREAGRRGRCASA